MSASQALAVISVCLVLTVCLCLCSLFTHKSLLQSDFPRCVSLLLSVVVLLSLAAMPVLMCTVSPIQFHPVLVAHKITMHQLLRFIHSTYTLTHSLMSGHWLH